MSRRKITVQGHTYSYVVGKSYVKIHDQAAVPVSEIGTQLGEGQWRVTPRQVSKLIRELDSAHAVSLPSLRSINQ